ncbi:MAG: hypothetical protein V3U24_10170 [Candidatus Neomarinimicrobiota bacterium]
MLDIPAKVTPGVGTVIVLHGWGASSRDVELLAEALRLPKVRYLIPQGEFDVPGTGDRGKAWYSLPPDENSQRERAHSRKKLMEILTDLETEGTPPGKVVFMGFSQGASMSFDVALNYSSGEASSVKKSSGGVAAVISLSGFLLDAETMKHRKNLPTRMRVFAGHGRVDSLIPLEVGKSSILVLRELGFDVEWKEYDADHRVVIDELEDVRRFLAKVFPL